MGQKGNQGLAYEAGPATSLGLGEKGKRRCYQKSGLFSKGCPMGMDPRERGWGYNERVRE